MREIDKFKKIFCPYCNAPYTGEMLHELFVCDESYTSDCVSAQAVSRIEIKCKGCKKVVYVKEVRERFDANDVPNLIDNREREED